MMHSKSIELLKQRYPAGTQLELIKMDGEPQMKSGLKGTVRFVDDIGQIHVEWENGSTLALNTEIDRFQKIGQSPLQEQTM